MESRSNFAVIGSGIAGLSAAWLLSAKHDVTLFEQEERTGGHSNTVVAATRAGATPVDTGFIVYNNQSYPNLIALFEHLGVPTARSNMSFAVSLDGGRYEYSGTGLQGIFGQRGNLVKPSHWRMLFDIRRFFAEAPRLLTADIQQGQSLGDYLLAGGYGDPFIQRHILPMAAAIWSASPHEILAFPAASFVRFFANHGLLQVRDRPEWRTVAGGSRKYIDRLLSDFSGHVATGKQAVQVRRGPRDVAITFAGGETETYAGCVIATHADQALAMLADPDPLEHSLLGAFRYQGNRAVLHADAAFMPRRRSIWSSWNYLGRDKALVPAPLSPGPCVTYWMNRLQPLGDAEDLFVTLNPDRLIAPDRQIACFDYAHPVFDAAAMTAQRSLWALQGRRRTWFCGSYFGYGFHEDALQAGLAVAEHAGGVRRPWSVPDQSGRIHLGEKSRSSVGGGHVPGCRAMSALTSCLYTGTVVHKRLMPRLHGFSYRVFSLCLDVDEIDTIARRCRLFSRNRANLLSFHDADHGPGDGQNVGEQIRSALTKAGLAAWGARIQLLCYPRILGFVFNPLSVYFCHDAGGSLGAIVYEVSNTFRERTSYIIPVKSGADGIVQQGCDKEMSVSPFTAHRGHYGFHVRPPAESVLVGVSLREGDSANPKGRPVLKTHFRGERRPLSDRGILTALAGHPLMTLKVATAIHYEAARLWFKGVPLIQRHRSPRFSVVIVDPRDAGPN